MATTAELIEMLHKCAEWFEHHGRNTNTAVIGICKQAAERLETLYNERMAAADEIDRVEAEVERLQNKCEDCAGCTQWLCDCANERNYVVEKFAERAKEKLRDIARVDFQGNYYYLIGESFFEDLAKEMKEYLAKEMECDAE